MQRLVRYYSSRAGLCYDDTEDCLIEYEARKLQRPETIPVEIKSPEARVALKREIRWFVRTWLRDELEELSRSESLDLLTERAAYGAAKEPESPLPGPEALAMRREEIRAAQRIVDTLPKSQAWLWRRVVFDGARIVDLAVETGRTENSLYLEASRIRRKIKRMIAADDAG